MMLVVTRYQCIMSGRRAEQRRASEVEAWKKMLENDQRSRKVYENKGGSDAVPEKKSDIYVETSDILVNWGAIARQKPLPWRHFVTSGLPNFRLNAPVRWGVPRTVRGWPGQKTRPSVGVKGGQKQAVSLRVWVPGASSLEGKTSTPDRVRNGRRRATARPPQIALDGTTWEIVENTGRRQAGVGC